jgi:3-deoxy-D-manno-octulosonic-acid transferase
MARIGYYIYNLIVVPLLWVGFLLGSVVSRKIRRGLRGRRQLLGELKRRMEAVEKGGPRFWIHSSSMGEFEQAKPVIQRIKEKFSQSVVVVSLFSPSVFDHVDDFPGADVICYMPFDSRRQSRRFIDTIRPDVAVMVRHDLWPNHLYQLKEKGIPAVLINGSIRSTHGWRFRFLVPFYRFLYRCFSLILTVSKETKDICESHRLATGPIEIVGDTRYDQVIHRAQEAEKMVASLGRLKGNRKTFVMGSTWPSDEVVLLDAIDRLCQKGKSVWYVIVPHEPLDEHVTQIEQRVSDLGLRACLLSEIDSGKAKDCDVLIVDRVGILASLYALGDLSFVGGGFGAGIHNVLEPAALGKAVFFGPRCQNSYEAGLLQNRGVGFIVRDGEALYQHLFSLLNNADRLKEIEAKATQVVQENAGATYRIVDHLETLV